ncbi:MAG: DUF4900 domain-containing protein [Candidatus Eisenbacteria bacterium]|uniref:DUF4900 domain-containing protein n=1 Tax=Eiseniibacteriota bacterium TaxID=2212470 RepID=A0A7Y2E7U3_UNCEI|nr:DUF4900 domain-containing protein [Candidatus Eisenbacteria bacterium]
MRQHTTNLLGNEKGMALVASLLVMVAITVIVVAVSVTSQVEKSTTVTHRTSNRALYAADSGIEAAKQQMTLFAKSALDSLNSVYGGTGAIIPSPQTFFPSLGLGSSHTGSPAYAANTSFSFEDSTLDLQSQAFNFKYTITSTGTYNGSSRSVVSEGRLRVSATRGSFTDYLIFTDKHAMVGGTPIWFTTSTTFDGRVHTNDKLRFAYYPTFHDHVTSVSNTADYYNYGSALTLNADYNGTKDVPNFYGGFDRGEANIALPTNSYSQERASLGGNPADTTPLTNAERRSLLGMTGTSSVPAGVYVPNSGGYVSGGLYISGDAKNAEFKVDTNNRQEIKIKDANNLWTTVTINHAANNTTVVPPYGSTQVYSGVPRGIMYTKGSIQDMRGPARSGSTIPPAIHSNTQMTIAATGDIRLQSDFTYQDYNNGENVIGLFTSGGNARIGTSAPDNVKIDAFVMTSGTDKSFTVDNYNYGSDRGQVRLTGGMISSRYGAFGTFGYYGTTGYGRDFKYDRRGKIPPYFPLTQRYTTDDPIPLTLAWREN